LFQRPSQGFDELFTTEASRHRDADQTEEPRCQMFDEQKAHGAVRLERARRSAEQVFDSLSRNHL
jgi:hypothetical protein